MNKRTSDQKSTMEEKGELLASFGEARLVKVNGRIRLQGGAMADRIEAMEWLALFMPDEPVEEIRPRRKACYSKAWLCMRSQASLFLKPGHAVATSAQKRDE